MLTANSARVFENLYQILFWTKGVKKLRFIYSTKNGFHFFKNSFIKVHIVFMFLFRKQWHKIYLVVWRTSQFFFLSYFVLRLTFENIIVIKPQDSEILNKLLITQIEIFWLSRSANKTNGVLFTRLASSSLSFSFISTAIFRTREMTVGTDGSTSKCVTPGSCLSLSSNTI